MYKAQMVTAIKVDGHCLREEGSTVHLPFGTEYAIYLRNLNLIQRAVLNITIDGNNVSGNGLVLAAGQTAELERAINNNLNSGHKFKFLERTAGIEAHRGIRPEDGLIIINYQFEKPPQLNYDCIHTYFKNNIRGVQCYASGTKHQSLSVNGSNQVGITGAGSVSNQSFNSTNVGVLEPQTYTIVYQLLGGVQFKDEPIQTIRKPVTVNVKKVCSLCGRKYLSSALFCSDDGNALQYENAIF